MGLSYVIEGAKLKCSYGDKESVFQVPMHHKTFISGKPQGNIMDFKPMINIQPFGLCSSLANPAVAAATAANDGRLKKMPYVPATVTPWMNGKVDCLVGDAPAIMNNSTLVCRWCGKIVVQEDGQE